MTAGAGWALTVDPASEGWRVDVFVARRIERLSRARAARLRVVDLDDPARGPLKKSAAVHAGQRLWVDRPIPDADAEPPEPRVIHLDARLLVLDKPAGLATHPTASRWMATVTRWLDVHHPGAEPAHRLDVETSGVLIASRTTSAARSLKAAFAQGLVSKSYMAIVEGSPSLDAWVDDTPLGFEAKSAVRLKMGSGALPASTAFRVLVRGRRSLVEASPRTGRQHQIRVHLAMAGLPIVGDKLYGADEALFLASLERPLDTSELTALGHPRHALHAWRAETEWGTFEAPLPPDLAGLLE